MWPTAWTETPQTLDLAALRAAVRRIAPHILRANLPTERAHRVFWSDGWVAATNGFSFGAVKTPLPGFGVLMTWMLDILFDLPITKATVLLKPALDKVEIAWAGGTLVADMELSIPDPPSCLSSTSEKRIILRADSLRKQIHIYNAADGLLIEGFKATARAQARCEKLHTSLEKRRFGYPLFDRYADARYLDGVLFTAQDQALMVSVPDPDDERGVFRFEGDDCFCLLGPLRK